MKMIKSVACALLLLTAAVSVPASGMTPPASDMDAPVKPAYYEAQYRAEIRPDAGTIHVELQLSGERLPRKIVWQMDPKRYRAIAASESTAGPLDINGHLVTWRPRGKSAHLSYDYVVNHERAPGHYDSLLTADWALFRGDNLVPRAKVTARRGLESRATLEFVLPADWTALSAYPGSAKRFRIEDPMRRFDRPAGWMIAGKLGDRVETIAGVHTIVAAPAGNSTRRQDMLAFLNWNLPQLLTILPTFPKRILIVSAGDPMWRGGLSGPASLFMHSDRPLISENRTSTLLHELVHVGMGIRGDAESDWIVEGFAEFYSIETLRRSGGISEKRYQAAMRKLDRWGERAPNLLVAQSSGAVTARAVMTLKAADEEIRKLSDGRASLDDVARDLANQHEEVSLGLLQTLAAKHAGQPLKSLERGKLTGSG
ncbi:MAG TPA: hypothetical protein VGN07_09145 [Steroidobacteraceae bacterium]|jgi:hypothetical protein